MDRLEMVDALRTRMNVTYEEAKNALEETEWNLLDAIVLLEGRGAHEASAKKAEEATSTVEGEFFQAESEAGTSEETRQEKAEDTAKKGNRAFRRFFQNAGKTLKSNTLEVTYEGKTLFLMPAWAFALLLLFTWHITVPVLLVALFFGVRYSFHGTEDMDKINKVMEQAGDAAEQMKQSFVGEE